MNSNGNNGKFIAPDSPFINKFTPAKITPIQNMMLKSKKYPRLPIIGPDAVKNVNSIPMFNTPL